MQYRSDRRGEPISLLGFGCMRFTRKGNSIDIDKAETEIMAAVEAGVNYFDTAYLYPGSEACLGEIVERNGIRDIALIKVDIEGGEPGFLEGAKRTICEQKATMIVDHISYNRIEGKNDSDIFMAMSSYALINIDEFDALSKSQQPILKYLISKHDVKFRPPYGKALEQRQRFASFIATTNNLRPLVDPTGSRRFICVYADEIDNSDYIRHDMLYAQLVYELKQGRRYWFEDEENQRIMKQNEEFQQVLDYQTMVEFTYLPPEDTPADAKPISLQDIMKRLKDSFPTFVVRKNTDMELGRRLSDMGYKRHKLNKGMAYRIAEKP